MHECRFGSGTMVSDFSYAFKLVQFDLQQSRAEVGRSAAQRKINPTRLDVEADWGRHRCLLVIGVDMVV